jgi:hypothetical protein
MRYLLVLCVFLTSGCSTNLNVIQKGAFGEGIVILSKTDEIIVAQVISFPSKNDEFFLKKINKYASNQCLSNYEINQSKDIFPIIVYECRSGGCGEFPEKSFVYEIKCPNNTP